jgi:hypothetical protein
MKTEEEPDVYRMAVKLRKLYIDFRLQPGTCSSLLKM